MHNDKVILIKSDGRKYTDISASVQKDVIFIDDYSLPIEEEDKILRELPSGLTETYNVIDRGYYEAFHSIPAHYEVKVEKETSNKKQSSEIISYNVVGNNSRININSNDNSLNLSTESLNEDNVFEKLRETINIKLNDKQKEDVFLSINELEQTKGSDKYATAYKSFIQKTKDWVEIVSPFIPLLSNFL
jgi:hypothetical protein